jgi:hypothetical protein
MRSFSIGLIYIKKFQNDDFLILGLQKKFGLVKIGVVFGEKCTDLQIMV